MHHNKYSLNTVVIFYRNWKQDGDHSGRALYASKSKILNLSNTGIKGSNPGRENGVRRHLLRCCLFLRMYGPCTWPVSHPGSRSKCPRDPILSRPLWLWGLQPFDCWDRGFEFCWGHGCPILCFLCCVGRGFCDGMITRSEESYRVWCVCMWSRNFSNQVT